MNNKNKEFLNENVEVNADEEKIVVTLPIEVGEDMYEPIPENVHSQISFCICIGEGVWHNKRLIDRGGDAAVYEPLVRTKHPNAECFSIIKLLLQKVN